MMQLDQSLATKDWPRLDGPERLIAGGQAQLLPKICHAPQGTEKVDESS